MARSAAPDPIDLQDAMPMSEVRLLPPRARFYTLLRRLKDKYGPPPLEEALLSLSVPERTVLMGSLIDEFVMSSGNGFPALLGCSREVLLAFREALERIGAARELGLLHSAIAQLPGGRLADTQEEHQQQAARLRAQKRSKARMALQRLERTYRSRPDWPDPTPEMLAYVEANLAAFELPPKPPR
jgi:hypothetical protein